LLIVSCIEDANICKISQIYWWKVSLGKFFDKFLPFFFNLTLNSNKLFFISDTNVFDIWFIGKIDFKGLSVIFLFSQFICIDRTDHRGTGTQFAGQKQTHVATL